MSIYYETNIHARKLKENYSLAVNFSFIRFILRTKICSNSFFLISNGISSQPLTCRGISRVCLTRIVHAVLNIWEFAPTGLRFLHAISNFSPCGIAASLRLRVGPRAFLLLATGAIKSKMKHIRNKTRISCRT